MINQIKYFPFNDAASQNFIASIIEDHGYTSKKTATAKFPFVLKVKGDVALILNALGFYHLTGTPKEVTKQ